jgi:glutamyl/glutaminyl-tRNA synthetase
VGSEVGRLAPTPSGELHLGNALAFGAAWLSVRDAGGRLLLRIEDLDRGRSRDDVAQRQREDLLWLGLDWDEEVTPQSQRTYDVGDVPTYTCDCSRKQRKAGGCTHRQTPSPQGALRYLSDGSPVSFVDRAQGPQSHVPRDELLIRRNGEPGYPWAVVQDDHRDGVTQVVRGADLLEATSLQVALYAHRGWTAPSFLHAPMLLGPDGRKLSKSHGAIELRALRDLGWTPERVWTLLTPMLGLPAHDRLGQVPLDPAQVPAGPFVIPPWA